MTMPNSSKSCAVALIAIISIGLLVPSIQISLFQSAKADSDYQYEFSLEGESTQHIGRWLYTTYDSQSKSVDVYAYCNTLDCTLVAFDITNQSPLYDEVAVSFFENYAISRLIFSDDTYKDPFTSSTVCENIIPSLRAEMVNLAVQAAQSGAGNYMSESEAKYLKHGIRFARTLGYIGDFNIIAFGFAAVCLGSNLFEQSVADEIRKCHDYLKDSKVGMVSQSRPYDLITCNEDLAKRLQESKLSPNVLIKNLEIIGKNFFSALNCIGSRESCPPPERMVTEVIDEMIPAVKAVASEVREAIKYAPQDAVRSNERITQKVQEASSILQQLDGEYNEVDGKVENHRWLNIARDWFYTPQYDLAKVEQTASLATQKHNEAHANLSAYKLNSAIAAVKQGMEYTKQTLLLVNEQESIERGIDTGKVLMLTLPALGVIGMLIFITTRHHRF